MDINVLGRNIPRSYMNEIYKNALVERCETSIRVPSLQDLCFRTLIENSAKIRETNIPKGVKILKKRAQALIASKKRSKNPVLESLFQQYYYHFSDEAKKELKQIGFIAFLVEASFIENPEKKLFHFHQLFEDLENISSQYSIGRKLLKMYSFWSFTRAYAQVLCKYIRNVIPLEQRCAYLENLLEGDQTDIGLNEKIVVLNASLLQVKKDLTRLSDEIFSKCEPQSIDHINISISFDHHLQLNQLSF